MAQIQGRARRWQSFAETVFTEFTALAVAHRAINLGQGSPGFDGPEFVKQAAAAAMARGDNQYAPMSGIPQLREVIASRFAAATGIAVDPDDNVTVTSGCAEALAASFLGMVDPGDEVVLIEPFYDLYPAGIAMVGATARHVTLRPPAFRLDETDLAGVVGPDTRMIVLNTPHNPVGRVFDRAELELVASVAIANDAVVVADEVYEHLVFEGEHVSIASLPGMWERTVTLSSLGKTFSLTGWKVGWAVGPPHLTDAVRAAHQFITFAVPTPLQHGAVAALTAPPSTSPNSSPATGAAGTSSWRGSPPPASASSLPRVPTSCSPTTPRSGSPTTSPSPAISPPRSGWERSRRARSTTTPATAPPWSASPSASPRRSWRRQWAARALRPPLTLPAAAPS